MSHLNQESAGGRVEGDYVATAPISLITLIDARWIDENDELKNSW